MKIKPFLTGMFLAFLMLALAAAVTMALSGCQQKAQSAETYNTNLTDALVLSSSSENAFLTISNRSYVQFGYSVVVRVTDSEWTIITNHYPNLIRTNQITFYGK